ncbi:hypothetical protein [Microbispora sp. GKU 823]|uniref:hypothetical protein n=1 Tax=Microbispora sp. GKU 823 TaxID=1652100 RepID=UPI0009A378C6|nr:hypothetical protein [Microbispora sp. GKU 823]OPG12679.1 hypothetical protein B1L11_13170 [Microbispora sp. GKU 823]
MGFRDGGARSRSLLRPGGALPAGDVQPALPPLLDVAVAHVYSLPVTVEVVDSYNPSQGCPGSAANQYKTVGDEAALAAWTYANGTHRCVEVSYRPKILNKPCAFWFEAPPRRFGQYAGKITFHFEYADPDGHPRDERVTIDEGSERAGRLGEHSGVERIWFGDDTGQRYPTKIAWGLKGHAGGLTQVCPA